MRSLTLLTLICSMLLSSIPALAVTGGKAWINFYKDCPSEIVEIEELTVIISSTDRSIGTRLKGVASPTVSSSAIASLSSSASISTSTATSTSSKPSKRSKFRSALEARNAEKTMLLSPAVNITQGQCLAVPIITSAHIDSRSVSVQAELLNITPFQDCNITVHEVPGCIDKPLIVIPIKNREAQSDCKPRNFDSFNDVWVKLDCSEIGTGTTKFKPVRSTVSRTRPVRRVF